MLRPGRTAVGTETVPTYRPGAIRTVPRGRVLIIHRNLPPILARAVDVTKRPNWATIRGDVQVVRAGSAPINPAGYALTAPGRAAATMPAGMPRW